MKHFIVLALSCILLSCTAQNDLLSIKKQLQIKSDSIALLQKDLNECHNWSESYISRSSEQVDSILHKDSVILQLRDSITKLSKMQTKSGVFMTAQQFIDLYKYESIHKYYRLCEKKPSNRKFFYGWVSRTISK
jgi:hypothetical protein